MDTTVLPPQTLIDRKQHLIDAGYQRHTAALFALFETLQSAAGKDKTVQYDGAQLLETLSSDFAQNNPNTYNLISRIADLSYESGVLTAHFDLSDYDRDYIAFGGGGGYIIIEPEAGLRAKINANKLIVLSAEGIAASKSEKKSKMKNFKIKSMKLDKHGRAELKVKVGFVTKTQKLKFSELFD